MQLLFSRKSNLNHLILAGRFGVKTGGSFDFQEHRIPVEVSALMNHRAALWPFPTQDRRGHVKVAF